MARRLFQLNAAEQFFYDHAGYSHDPATESAQDGRIRASVILADAERRLAASICHVEWEPDDEPWDGDEPYDGPLSVALIIRDDGTVLGSLSQVCSDGTGDYARVIGAELAAEYLTP